MNAIIVASWTCAIGAICAGFGFALQDVNLRYVGRAVAVLASWAWLISAVILIVKTDLLFWIIAIGTSFIYAGISRLLCRAVLRRVYSPQRPK